MTPQERKSIDNGIWMCKSHARMIDSDYTNYSADTLRQWKNIAETEVYQIIMSLGKDQISLPTTLVSIGEDLIFEGIWKSADNNNSEWVFQIHQFIIGNEHALTSIENNDQNISKYVVIETQGDGRIIDNNVSWELVDGSYEIHFQVQEKSPRTPVSTLWDIATPMKFENGDFKQVRGVDCAKQMLSITLSIDFGELWFEGNFGSFMSIYYWVLKENKPLLNRFIKLEITRLLSIPYWDSLSKTASPPLNFINRVLDVSVGNSILDDDKLKFRICLEWENGQRWEDEMSVYVKPIEKVRTNPLYRKFVDSYGLNFGKLNDE